MNPRPAVYKTAALPLSYTGVSNSFSLLVVGCHLLHETTLLKNDVSGRAVTVWPLGNEVNCCVIG